MGNIDYLPPQTLKHKVQVMSLSPVTPVVTPLIVGCRDGQQMMKVL